MAWKYINLEICDGIANIILNRPEKLNALGIGPRTNRAELADALEIADADPKVGAILISAAGRAFCAGGDMSGTPRGKTPFDHHQFNRQMLNFYARVHAIQKPTVAAVHGMCFGSGMGLIAQFDIVIAAENTKFGLIEGRTGHPGATELVPLIGPKWAKYLILTGEVIDAARAVDIGLILVTTPAEQLFAKCKDLATRISSMPRESTILNKACIDSISDAMGRYNGRMVGRIHDTLTRATSNLATAPDGRTFDDILKEGGVAAVKQARDQQFDTPWLAPSQIAES